jgi:predicted RNase H-like HicB family nuclease
MTAISGAETTGYAMNSGLVVIERCRITGLWVGHVPYLAGAHSQAASLGELRENLREVLDLIDANERTSFDECWPTPDR